MKLPPRFSSLKMIPADCPHIENIDRGLSQSYSNKS